MSYLLEKQNPHRWKSKQLHVRPWETSPTPEKHCTIRGTYRNQDHSKTSHARGERRENKQKVDYNKRARKESCFGKRREGEQGGGGVGTGGGRRRKRRRRNIKSVRKARIGLFLSGCRRSNNTQHPRLKSLHAENEENICSPHVGTPRKARKRG